MMKKILLSTFVSIITFAVYGKDVIQDGLIYYVNEDDTQFYAQVIGYTDEMPSDITIPNEISYNGKQYPILYITGFEYCKRLKSIDLSSAKNLITIGYRAFYECKNLESIEFSGAENLTRIEYGAFALCSALESIDLSCAKKLSYIDDTAFMRCKSLTSIDLSGTHSLTLGDFAFSECDKLSCIDLSHFDNLSLMDCVFSECTNLAFIKMPKSIKEFEIGAQAFWGCTSLAVFDIPEGTTSIGREAFMNCDKLRDIKLPEGLQYIEDGAFYACYGFSEPVIIPQSVKSIGTHAFQYNPGFGAEKGIKTFEILSETPPTFGENPFSGFATIYVPENCVKSYRDKFPHLLILAQDYEMSLDVTVPQPGKLLSCLPIERLVDISSLKIKGEINGTDIQVINKCTGLFHLDLGEARIVAGGNKYYENYFTKTDILTEKMFYNIKRLKSIVLPSAVTSIESGVFNGIYTLKKVVFPETLTYIGDEAFDECDLDTIRIPKSVKTIGTYAFYDNRPKSVIFDGYPTIYHLAFFNFASNIPVSERSVHTPSLDGWMKMDFVSDDFWGPYTNPLTSMHNLYVNGEKISDIIIPANINTLGKFVFYNSTPFHSVWVNSYNPPNMNDAFWLNIDGVPVETVLYVPEGAEIDYWLDAQWGQFKHIRTFKPADLNNCTLSHEEIDINPNESFQLGIYKPGREVKNVEWSSSNSEVAYVNKCGLVTAMCENGTCEITAAVDGQRLKCYVSVSSHGLSRADNPKIEPSSIEFVSITTNPDMMNVRLSPVGASTTINWLSDDPQNAIIDNGLISYISPNETVKFYAITDNGQVAHSPEVMTSGIDDVLSESDTRTVSNDIYNLQGICVKRNATFEDLNNLSPGIYIYRNQKFIVR